jgi:asparagine synthase (glutamine-hydrolysing)
VSLSGALGNSCAAASQGVHNSLARQGGFGETRIATQGTATFGASAGSSLEEDQDLVFAFDGVLWERDRILRALSLRDCADAAIGAAAYRRWGDGFAFHLHGAFAFALWDIARQRLLLGRDTAGARSLYYAQLGEVFLFASHLSGLSSWPGVDMSVYDPAVAAGICNLMPRHLERTTFQGIRRLLPATTLAFDSGGVTTSAYWSPLNIPVWRGADVRDYARAMRQTLRAAIAQRLPRGANVGTRLSSGWDSSTVTALAAQILAEQGSKLTAFTSVPATPVSPERLAPMRRFPDESKLAAEVAALYPNVDHVLVPNAGPALGDAMARVCLTNGLPGLFRGVVMIDAMSAEAQRRNIDVMLGGSAGNQTTSYGGIYGPWTLRREGRWRELLVALRARLRSGATPKSVMRSVFSPTSRLASLLGRLKGHRPGSIRETPAVNPKLLERCGIQSATSDHTLLLQDAMPQDGRALRAFILASADLGLGQDFTKWNFSCDFHDPTGDRRVVELCLSIPDEAFAPAGVPRGLARLAFESDLPVALLDEPMRGLQAPDFCERFDDEIGWLRAELNRMKASPTIRGYIDLDALQDMLETWPGAGAASVALDMRYSIRFGQPFSWGYLLRLLEDRGGRL